MKLKQPNAFFSDQKPEESTVSWSTSTFRQLNQFNKALKGFFRKKFHLYFLILFSAENEWPNDKHFSRTEEKETRRFQNTNESESWRVASCNGCQATETRYVVIIDKQKRNLNRLSRGVIYNATFLLLCQRAKVLSVCSLRSVRLCAHFRPCLFACVTRLHLFTNFPRAYLLLVC